MLRRSVLLLIRSDRYGHNVNSNLENAASRRTIGGRDCYPSRPAGCDIVARVANETTTTQGRQMNVNKKWAGAMLASVVLLSGAAGAGEDPKVAAEVMALARAQWASEIAGKGIAEQMASVADDYTEFNPDYGSRLEGKDLNVRLYEAISSDGSKSLAGDMVNPKVQVYGDTAVLTYNFVGVTRDKEGKVAPSNAKSTRVYSRVGGKWMLVHANFAPAPSKY
jgi:ketosteroid isomerase-like protein